MLYLKRFIVLSLFVIATLVLSACQPVVAEPVAQQAEEAALGVVDQFLQAYEAYDTDKLLSLHTDDAVWTWIDPGKNFPDFAQRGSQSEPATMRSANVRCRPRSGRFHRVHFVLGRARQSRDDDRAGRVLIRVKLTRH